MKLKFVVDKEVKSMKHFSFINLTRICVGVLLTLSVTGCNISKDQSFNERVAPIEQTSLALCSLKEGNIYDLVGFHGGDAIDEEKVEKTGAYLNGGEIFVLKEEENKDLLLFFWGPNESFSGLGAHQKGNFFGINIGEDGLQKVKDVLGEPDIYQEKDDMNGTPLAIYYFEKASLYIEMNTENKITSIQYVMK